MYHAMPPRLEAMSLYPITLHLKSPRSTFEPTQNTKKCVYLHEKILSRCFAFMQHLITTMKRRQTMHSSTQNTFDETPSGCQLR